MAGGVSVLQRAWRDGQRCGGGKRLCQHIWNSAKTSLRFPRRTPVRSSLRNNLAGVKHRGRVSRTNKGESFNRRIRPTRLSDQNPSRPLARSISISKTTPHPLDEYIFSTLLKRTKHKRNSPKLAPRWNNYVNHSNLTPAYNERCIDSCVAAAAAAAVAAKSNQENYYNITKNCIRQSSPGSSSCHTQLPRLPPRPYPRTKIKIAPPRPMPRSKPRAMTPIKENVYARPKKYKKDPPSTPSSSGVSSGEEGAATSSHNTTRDASSYMDPKDAAEIWQMTGRQEPITITKHSPYLPPADEVESVMSSVSWNWCAVSNQHRRVHNNLLTIENDYRPPLPPKKGNRPELKLFGYIFSIFFYMVSA